MTAHVIYGVDFKGKTYNRPQTLQEMAQDIASQIGGLIGEEVACEMVPKFDPRLDYFGPWRPNGIDGMKFEPEDCA